MKEGLIPNVRSITGATISLVTSSLPVDGPCAPCEECRPACDTDTSPDCAPDCTCEPVCDDQEKQPAPERSVFPGDEDQDCEPNT